MQQLPECRSPSALLRRRAMKTEQGTHAPHPALPAPLSDPHSPFPPSPLAHAGGKPTTQAPNTLTLAVKTGHTMQHARQSGRRNLPDGFELPTACPSDDTSCVYSCLAAGFSAQVCSWGLLRDEGACD